MALHMVDDPNGQDDFEESNSGGNNGGRGGGFNIGGALAFLPLVIGLFKRGGGQNTNGGGQPAKGCGGKGLLLLLLVGVALYFLWPSSCNPLQQAANTTANSGFSETGYNFNADQTRKAQVYEGLEDDNKKNPLPERISLAAYAPTRQSQGKQGSCVAWSTTYAARTILEAASTKQDANSIAYSPAFMYNNIALDNCQGAYIQKAMEFMQANGAVRYQDFKYDENDCSRQANQTLLQQAQQNKILGFHRLTESDDVNVLNIRAVKEHLAKDAPVVIGMMVGGTFMQDMVGQKVWNPTATDKNMTGFGGHAMCVIGYDDRVEGGAFEIMNSWGPEWGQNGLGFVRYADFKEFVREAYGLDPLPKRGAALNQAFECNIGLVNTDTKSYIPLASAGTNIFKTKQPIKKGAKFKIEIKNMLECYIYIFTPDVAGKSSVLFPYKPIHSPYCGITGYRLFPRKESIQADEVGNEETMGIVISKIKLDYDALNNSINASAAIGFADKLKAGVGGNAITNATFGNTTNGMMYFKSMNDPKSIVTCIVKIDKQ